MNRRAFPGLTAALNRWGAWWSRRARVAAVVPASPGVDLPPAHPFSPAALNLTRAEQALLALAYSCPFAWGHVDALADAYRAAISAAARATAEAQRAR